MMRKKTDYGIKAKSGKRMLALTLLWTMLAGILSGCSDSGEDTALADLNTDKYIKVGDYSAFEISVAPKLEVTDEDVDSYIQYVLALNPIRISDAMEYTVKPGDTANIDFEGKRDGVAFEGGTGKGYDLTIGSGAFIPGFEDGLIGAGVGETRDIPLTFPEDYENSEELAGEDVVFTVTVNYVYTTELTDELAAKINKDTPTAAQYREYAKNLLLQDAQLAYDSAVYTEITNILMADSKVKKDAPENLIDRYFKQQVSYVTQLAKISYNMSYEELIQNTGVTVEAYEATMRENAVSYANNMVLYQAIANAENLAVTEEEIQAEAERNAESGEYASAEAFLASVGREEIEDYLMRTKVMEFLLERTTIIESENTSETTGSEDLQGAMDILDGATGE